MKVGFGYALGHLSCKKNEWLFFLHQNCSKAIIVFLCSNYDFIFYILKLGQQW